MPTADISEALKEAYSNASSDDVTLETLEIHHSTILDENNQPTAIRIVRDYGVKIDELPNGQPVYGQMLTLESDAPLNAGQSVQFISCPFDFDFPGQEEGRIPELNIRIENVTRLVSQYLDNMIATRESVSIIFRSYLLSDLSQPQYVLDGFKIQTVASDAFSVTATARYEDLITKGFPSIFYTPERFPGLVQ
jgi:hypothetical protein